MPPEPSGKSCPRCVRTVLQPVLTRQGVEVDNCPTCGGTWLDQGEIYFFTRRRRLLARELKEALATPRDCSLKSPETGHAMKSIRLFGRIEVNFCPESEGIWFDKGELRDVARKTRGRVSFSVDDATRPRATLAPRKIHAGQLKEYARGMRPLPNLVVRSASCLVLLYALLGAALIACVEFADFPAGAAVGTFVTIVALQFAISPFIMDWSLSLFYRCRWVERGQLPDHLMRFVDGVAEKQKLNFPRFGIIDDGAPNAFTYGHYPGNARIVITRGLFELLDEKELEAVVAHEIGHAVHWDILIMTVAQLVPLITYYIYRTLIRIRVEGRDKSAAGRYAVAAGAFIIYIVSEYVVLWLSRTREYWADHFGGEATGDPNLLARALVKIGYGLAGREEEGSSDKEEERAERKPGLEAIGALGIFDADAARSLAITSGAPDRGGLELQNVKGAMRWDLWNPWARFYELNSTHPLIANRLDYLGRQAAKMQKEPFVVFDEKRPESYWDDFAKELVIFFLPVAIGGAMLLVGWLTENETWTLLAPTGLGVGMLLKTLYAYRWGVFPEMKVSGLLRKVKVSPVRGVPCTLKGRVIGRGVPGLIWSEDFVIRDPTGILFLDYRQPLRIFEFLFGLLRRQTLENAEVVAKGWYRRAPVPYMELLSITHSGRSRRCYAYHARLAFALFLIGLGPYLALASY